MQRGVFIFLAGPIFLFGNVSASSAQEKIQAFVSPRGKVIFTNLADNSAIPPATIAPSQADLLASEIPAPLKTLVDSISRTHGVDAGLVQAVIKTESNFNRWAVSKKGARGLMQLMPETGRRLGVRDFFDPQQNVDAGVRHLKSLLEKFDGDLDLSLAAYNAGENLVERIGRIPAYPETRNYVRKIRTLYLGNSPTSDAAADSGQEAAKTDNADRLTIFKAVDDRGVVYFSNIEPPR